MKVRFTKKLKIKVPAKIKFDELNELLSSYKAFQNLRLLFHLFFLFLIHITVQSVKARKDCRRVRTPYYILTKVPLRLLTYVGQL